VIYEESSGDDAWEMEEVADLGNCNPSRNFGDLSHHRCEEIYLRGWEVYFIPEGLQWLVLAAGYILYNKEQHTVGTTDVCFTCTSTYLPAPCWYSTYDP